MLSLFDTSVDTDEARRRKRYRDRLREIATEPDGQDVPRPEAEEKSQTYVSPVTPQPSPLLPVRLVLVADAAAQTTRVEPYKTDHDAPEQSQNLAGQIAVQLAAAITGAIKELHRVAAHDREQLEASLARVSAFAEEIHTFGKDLATLSQQSESMVQSNRTLSLKSATVEARLRDYEENRQVSSKKVESLEKRLGSQAEAIRSLHSGIREWGGRQEELRVTLQKLVSVSSTLPMTIQLPEDL